MPPDRQRPVRGPRNGKGLSDAVALSNIHVTKLFSPFPPQLRGRTTLGVVRGLPHRFPFHQPHERTYGWKAIWPPSHEGTIQLQTSIPFSGIQTQALRHSSQCQCALSPQITPPK
ncbi:hypothetical protein TNCV_1766881 [Trichonephila clavipes]|nr:hypothetical protein TNCV_1766881 [Trichonephila clavipes]